jgi:hypothetical protein
MEYHATMPRKNRFSKNEASGREPRSEPSWPAVIATTLRLWFQRRVMPRVGGARRRWILAAVAVLALGAGTLGIVLAAAGTSTGASRAVPAGTSFRTPQPQSSVALGASATTRSQAALWVAGQVAGSAVIACDPAMCAALLADGIPAGRLLSLGTAAADPLGSDVVAATPALRSLFGARLESVYAPTVLASFGSGANRIDILATAPDGTAAAESALQADLAARVTAGRQLLRNPSIAVSGAARAQLRAGHVDSRLLITIAALVAQQPVRIVAFDHRSPGAGPAVPLRGAVLAPLHAGTHNEAGLLASVLSFLDAQRAPFAPLRASVAGAMLSVQYAAPSPLGLLGGP